MVLKRRALVVLEGGGATYNKPRKVRWDTPGAAVAGRTGLPGDLEGIRKKAARYRKLRDRVLRKVRDPAVHDQLLTGGH